MSCLPLGKAARPGNLHSRLGKKHFLKPPLSVSLETPHCYFSRVQRSFRTPSCQPLGSAAQLWVFDTGEKTQETCLTVALPLLRFCLPARGHHVTARSMLDTTVTLKTAPRCGAAAYALVLENGRVLQEITKDCSQRGCGPEK